jgi:ethanolamine ammonia-lyase large subunit
MKIAPARSRVVIETTARGVLAVAGHDLRIEAPVADGEADDERCAARFRVAEMRVVEMRRHGTKAWGAPTSDAKDIERRIREEAFAGVKEITVEATRETIAVRAARTARVKTDATITANRIEGACALSLAALGVGKIRVPLGAIKLDDAVGVTYVIVLE